MRINIRTWLLHIGVLAQAFALAAGNSGCTRKEAVEDTPQLSEATAVEASVDSSSATRPRSGGRIEPANAAAASSRSSASRICVSDCRNTGPLEAVSGAEADWLMRHQYPSAAELAGMQALPLDALRQQASLGNPTASAVLGKRISLEKDFLEGQVILRNQALSGNYYAFYAMSESYRESSTPNLVDAAAYLRLAYILGDNKASTQIARMNLSPIELVAADSRASRLYRGFAGDQIPDPRPQE